MSANESKIALSNARGKIVYAIFNILGLTVGISICALILLNIQDELSFDRYHEKAKQIYRVESRINGIEYASPITPAPLAKALTADFPEVLNATRLFWPNVLIQSGNQRFYELILWQNVLIQYGNQRFYENRFYFTDSSFFEIFTVPFIKGDPKTALSEPDCIVITKEMASKYFGDENPIGKTLSYQNEKNLRITGVSENVPQNSHFHFDFLASLSTLDSQQEQNWLSFHGNYTYILLAKNYPPQQLEEKFPEFKAKYIKSPFHFLSYSNFFLQPLTDIHLKSNSIMTFIYIFLGISFLILILVPLNYINLATARLIHKAKATGLNKISHPIRMQLTRHFFKETLLFSFIAFIGSIILVALLLPVINSFTGKAFALTNPYNLLMPGLAWLALLIFSFIVSYPAFFICAYHFPAVLLKSLLNLVQFAIAITLIIITMTTYKQMDFLQNKDLGFTKNHVIEISLQGLQELSPFEDALRQSPDIIDLAAFSGMGNFSGSVFVEGSVPDNSNVMYIMAVDYNFVQTLGLQIVQGRNFSKASPSDAKGAFLVNETAVRTVGWESPIGRKLDVLGRKGSVVGVVKDFHYKPLYKGIDPIVLYIEPSSFKYLFVKIKPQNVSSTIAFIENKWGEFVPDWPFEHTFLDEKLKKQYKTDEKAVQFLGFMSFYSIFIALFGIYGLVSYFIRHYGKNKIIKAWLISTGIICILLFIPSIIAWPVAYYALTKWLENFAYRIALSIGPFFITTLLLFVIAELAILLTAGFYKVKSYF